MTRSEAWVTLAAAAFALSLGLAACDDGDPTQQSSAPTSEEPGDAAAMPESQSDSESGYKTETSE